jgi:OOP family OmpA-OmpF porin
VLLDYAHRPLLLRDTTDSADVEALVERQMFLHVDGSLALWNRVLVDLDIPVAVLQSGASTDSPSSADFGDLRLGLRVRLLGDEDQPFQLAVGGYLWLPTGTGSYVTDGTVRGLPQLIAGGLYGPVVWSAAAGVEIRASQTYLDAVEEGTALYAGAGIGLLLGAEKQIQIGPEAIVSTVLSNPESRNTNLEVLLQGRYRFLDAFEVGLGAGPGLTTGIGTPAFRLVAMFSYAPGLGRDAADDDEDEAASKQQSGKNVQVSGTVPAGGGSTSDNTQSTTTKAVAADTDGDGVSDDDDACPTVAGAADSDPEKNGCPTSVTVTDDEIVLPDQVYFDTGQATITSRSDALLYEVAEVLVAHPEILRVEVQGHTDIRGKLDSNMLLAEARAKAVRDVLVNRSIDPGRLVVKAYGPNDPAAPNETAAGRRRNRRVELEILEKKPAESKPQ